MRRASGPPLSPVAWVSAEDDSSHREKYQRFDLPGPYYQAEVLLRTESPGIDSPNFKARILRINFQIVDVPVVPLYAGPHLHSADESAVNKVLSIRVELSEPIALFRPVPQLPIWGRGNDEESEQEDEESDEDYDQSDEKDDENDEKDDESDEEDEEDGEANANRMLDEDPNTEEQESKAEQVWTRLRKWTWRASRRIRGGVVRVWRDNQR
ncbi:hypothetical protein BV20DRAFT_818469 [Pilatotrama ljubarskyi]|nr:hypothetical protein BV20DRAFT_818469 [Pilatotrama ljubarskyi]